MKKTILTAMAVALGLGFVGCDEEKAYTREYFLNNKEALEKQLEKCKNAEKLSAVEMTNYETAKDVDTRNKQTQWNF